MKAILGAAAAALLLIPALAGASPLDLAPTGGTVLIPGLQALGELCTINDDIKPQIGNGAGKGDPQGGPIDFGQNRLIKGGSVLIFKETGKKGDPHGTQGPGGQQSGGNGGAGAGG